MEMRINTKISEVEIFNRSLMLGWLEPYFSLNMTTVSFVADFRSSNKINLTCKIV